MSDDDLGSDNLNCGVCRFTTEDDQDFLEHYEKEHKKEMILWCRDCSRIVQSPADLLSHIRGSCARVKSFAFRCGIQSCDFTCEDAYMFMDHCKVRHKGVLLIPCHSCTRLFTMPSFLIRHMQTECSESKQSKKPPRSDTGDESKNSRTKTSPTTSREKPKSTGARTKTPPTNARGKSKATRTKTGRAGSKTRPSSKKQSVQGGSASTSRLLREKNDGKAEEYFSLYGKKLDPIDLSNIHIESSQSSTFKFTGPVEELMKLANFNVRLSVPDVKKEFL